jgi:outer membrane immunogenic protein
MKRPALAIPALAIIVLAALLTAPAVAADMRVKAPVYKTPPPLPVFSWTGVYIGGNIGYGWKTADGGPGCTDEFGVQNGPFCQVVPDGHVKASGVFGGGQIGFNWQTAWWVWGVETDVQASDIRGSATVNGPFAFFGDPGQLALPPATFIAAEHLEWFGTTRLRLGYAAIDRVLLYVTGGVAYGTAGLSSNFLAPNAGTTYPASASVTRVGWVAGGGLEYAVTPNWSAKLEGLYIDLGQTTTVGHEVPFTFPPLGFTRSKEFDLQYALVRFGLNYKLGLYP